MKKLLILCLSGFLSLLFANIGKISVSKGEVSVIRNNTNLQASNNFILEKSDQIKTGADGKAQLIFTDNTLITIGAKSTLNVSEYVFDEQNQKAEAQFNVVEGTFRTITGKIGKTNPDKFKLQTKSASIGIRGTIFGGDENKLFCEDGQIAVNSNGVEVILNKDQIIEVSSTQPPSTPRTATKQEKEAVKESSGSNDPEMQQNEQSVVEQKNSDTAEKQETKEETTQEETTQEETTQEQTTQEQTTQEQATNEASMEEGSFEATPTPQQEAPTVVNVDNVVKNVEETKTSTNDAKKQDTLVSVEEDKTVTTSSSSSSSTQTSTSNTPNYGNSDNHDEDDDEHYTQNPIYSTYTTQEGLEFEYITKSGTTVVNTNTYYSQFQITPTLFTDTESIAQLEYKGDSYHNWIDLGEITLSKNSPYDYNQLQEKIVSFTGTLADETNSYSYDYTLRIVYDNKGEFFTLHRDTVDGGFFHYDLGYSGTAPNTELLLEPSILHYTPNYVSDYRIDEFTTSTNLKLSEFPQSLGSVGNGYFINTSNQNGYLANFFVDYGQNFTVLRLNSDDGSISGETYSNFSWDYSDEMITQDSFIGGSLYGSELQGLGLTIDEGRTSSNLTPSNEIFKQINTAYLKENRELYVPTSGTSTMQGYLQGVGLNINSSLALSEPITTSSNPFEFSVDKSTGNFTATGTNYAINTSNEYLQSYYVDESKFGSLITSMTQGAYSLVPLNSSWFFTIPDTLNEYDATYSYDNDDYSSWGYWTATLEDSSNNLLQYTNSSTWVAGVTTPTETIDFLLSTSKPTYTFNGQVLGNVINANGIEFTPIDLNGYNSISLTINFSNPSVTGTIGFTSNFGADSWSATTTTSGVTNTNFTAGLAGTVGANTTTGSLEGKYYGPNLQSVGGKFELTSTGGDVASGVFKAKKPLPTN